MRKEDIERLSKKYPSDILEKDRIRLAKSLGLRVEEALGLFDEILADLKKASVGVNWWSQYADLGEKRRIGISDHLLLCADGIRINILEAKIHQLEAQHSFEQDALYVNVHAKTDPSTGDLILRPVSSPRESPIDDIISDLGGLHLAGFFRAMASAFDCLGACIIGVLALRKNLLRSDLGKATDALQKLVVDDSPGRSLQLKAKAAILTVLEKSGPPGWLEWTIDYRNLYVHRARRLQMSMLEPTGPVKEGVNTVKSVPQLATDPDRSEMEIFSEFPWEPLLRETAITTMDGVVESACSAINETCAVLKNVWLERRKDPTLLIQPHEQWPDFRMRSEGSKFQGYKKNLNAFNPGMLTSNPTLLRRMASACLDDSDREKWNSFS